MSCNTNNQSDSNLSSNQPIANVPTQLTNQLRQSGALHFFTNAAPSILSIQTLNPSGTMEEFDPFDETRADDETTRVDDTTSPIAPRFCKESQRGVKRHLEFNKYKAEVNRKKAVGLTCQWPICQCAAVYL